MTWTWTISGTTALATAVVLALACSWAVAAGTRRRARRLVTAFGAPDGEGQLRAAAERRGALAPVVAAALRRLDAERLVALHARQAHETDVRLGVDLSRRNQELIEAQLARIDELERDEQDPDRLDELFELDRLAARMRRNSESLLVLAGVEPRRWDGVVPVPDVLQQAAAEGEHLDRVRIDVRNDLVVTASAALDVTHLLAEVFDVAGSTSPDGPILVTARVVDVGCVVSVRFGGDAGAALSDHPTGFAVIDRLAGRHRLAIDVFPDPGGTGVEVRALLPSGVIERRSAGRSGFEPVEWDRVPVAAGAGGSPG